jgi:hypothetical protein
MEKFAIGDDDLATAAMISAPAVTNLKKWMSV